LTGAGVPPARSHDTTGALALAGRLGLDPVVEVLREDGTAARLRTNPIGLSATPPV